MKLASLLSSILLLACLPSFGALQFETSHVEIDAEPGVAFVDAEYPLRNSGDSTVSITRIKPSCGCTFAEVGDRELAPGESTILKTRFEIGQRQGEQRKSIRVETNSGAYVVTLTVNIPLRWEIDTRLLAWDVSKEDGRDAKDVKVVFNYNTPVEFVDVLARPAEFAASVQSVEAGKGRSAFTISVDPASVSPNVRGSLRAVFRNSKGEEETITVFLRTM